MWKLKLAFVLEFTLAWNSNRKNGDCRSPLSPGALRLAAQFRYAGVLLECFGFGMVVLGLEKTRQEFGQPSTLVLIESWVRLFASAFRKRWRPLAVSTSGSSILFWELAESQTK
jgi:hypothetical protein